MSASAVTSATGGRALRIGGRIDQYVLRLFLLSYLAAFFLVVGLYLVIDMATHLDEYMAAGPDGTAPSSLAVLHLYALQLPFLYVEMSPFVSLIAGLFTAARLSKANEIVAVLGAGVSTRRLLAPVLVCGAVFAVGMFALREWSSAGLALRRDVLEEQLREQRAQPVYQGIWVKTAEGVTVRVSRFLPTGGPGGGPQIEGLSCQVDEGDALAIYAADVALPLDPPEAGRWRLEGGHVLRVTPTGQVREEVDRLEGVYFTPGDVLLFHRAMDEPLQLSFAGALRVLERRPEDTRVRTVLHYHLTFPLAGFVLLLVGLPFLVGQERGRGAERVGAGLLLCVAYFVFDFVTRTLGLQGAIGPIHAGWLTVVLFGCLGVVLFGSMRS